MKLIKYVNAYMALGVLAKAVLPAPTAYALYKLRREIAPKVDFFSAEEKKIAERFGARRADGSLDIRNGRVTMKGDTDDERSASALSYARERDALCALDDNEVLAVPLVVLPRELAVAPEVFEALDGFCVIEVNDDAK